MIPKDTKEHETFRSHSIQAFGWVTAFALIGTFIGLEIRRRQEHKRERGHIWEGEKLQETPKD